MMKGIVGFVTVPLWVFGVIVAQGFWSTLLAFVIPFYAWYLALEHLATRFNLL